MRLKDDNDMGFNDSKKKIMFNIKYKSQVAQVYGIYAQIVHCN